MRRGGSLASGTRGRAPPAGADRLSGPEDYTGSGTGRVVVEVKDGDAAADIGNTLVDKGVVKSVGAFTDAARRDSKSVGIQVGFYEMKKQMSAKAALAVLVDPENRSRSRAMPIGVSAQRRASAPPRP